MCVKWFLRLDYITGYTYSSNFPTQNPTDPSHNGNVDLFIAQLNNSTLEFSTFWGGGADDYQENYGTPAVYKNGNLFLTGHVGSGFPATSGAFDETHNGNNDATVVRFQFPTGNLSANVFCIFGDIAINLITTKDLVIYNTGVVPVNVSALNFTGTFWLNPTSSVNPPFSIAPADSVTLLVSCFPLTTGLTSGTLSIVNDSPVNPYLIYLYANGLNPKISVNPVPVIFGNISFGTTDTTGAVLNVTNSGATNLTLNGLTITGQNASVFGSVTQFPVTIAPGQSEPLNLYFLPAGLSVGNFTAELEITSNALNNAGVIGFLASVIFIDLNETQNSITELYSLEQNFPNPFNPNTSISYTLAKANNVKLEVYNTKGELVRTLVNEKQNKGSHTSNWNGKDFSGKQVSSGIYFYQLKAENFSETKKMVLLK